jgi:hypothetical protein
MHLDPKLGVADSTALFQNTPMIGGMNKFIIIVIDDVDALIVDPSIADGLQAWEMYHLMGEGVHQEAFTAGVGSHSHARKPTAR